MITCIPWNPVAIKKVEPKVESEIVKDASIYSKACNAVKYTPNKIVIIKACFAWEKLASIKLWCAQVTETPDDNRIAVFKRGIWKGLNGTIPVGGQIDPISETGDKLLWKKAQKNEMKNRTSEVIKRIIPHRKPTTTNIVWCPWNVPSREISRHHWNIVINKMEVPNSNNIGDDFWNIYTIP